MKGRIVVLGMMTKIPVAGVVWQTIHYLDGFRRLGFDVYYVEAHGRTPSMLLERTDEDWSTKAAGFIDDVLRRFGMGDRWALHALHDDGSYFGKTEQQVRELYRTADLIINLHGGTLPRAEHSESGRLICLETDPVELEVELHRGDERALDFMAGHKAFFTSGLNYGKPDCNVPIPDGVTFHASPPVVVMDYWEGRAEPGEVFTTVGNWRQDWRNLVLDGELYFWSKHHEFLKFIDLPSRTAQPFELALSSYDEADRALLVANGWRVRPAVEISSDADTYRAYVIGSRGEFTVAKDQNIRLRSGWFSERSAVYLAAGRPVINQDTAFDGYLPTGRGLFSFTNIDEILDAIELINSNPRTHAEAAREIARAYLAHDVVLPRLLDDFQADARGYGQIASEEPLAPEVALAPLGATTANDWRPTGSAVPMHEEV